MFLLYGHPDVHGGPDVELPVLCYDDGKFTVLVNPTALANSNGQAVDIDGVLIPIKSPPSFQTLLDCQNKCASISMKLRAIESILDTDVKGGVTGITVVPNGQFQDFPAKAVVGSVV